MAFHRSSNAPTQAAKVIATGLLDYLPNEQRTFRILDIGCGGGEITRGFIEPLALALPRMKIHLLAIDPSGTILSLAREHLQSLPVNVTVEFKQAGVFPQPAFRLARLFGKGKFDFLLASFMMFWVDDWSNGLEQFLECLQPNGLLCVTLNCRSPGKKGADFRQRIFEIAHQETEYQMEFAEDLEKILRNHKLDYDVETVCDDLVLSPVGSDKISEEMEFMIRLPQRELTPQQFEVLKKHTDASLQFSPLLCCKKIIWVIKQ